MILIFGGAYQGKIDYVKQEYKVSDCDIFFCECSKEPDCTKKVIANIEKYIYALIASGKEPIDYFIENIGRYEDKIIICEDITCGVVPIDKQMRLYRDNVGKIMQLLARRSASVYRVFCGIGEKLK